MNYMWGEEICETGGMKDIHVYRVNNEIWFNYRICDESINKVIKLIYEVIHDEKYSAFRDTNDKKLEIVLHVDSPGGCVKSVFKFVDFIQLIKKRNIRLRTIINGCAASAATIMAIVGDEREITAHSYAMIHELSSAVHGKYTQIKSYTKCLDFLHNKIIDIYHKYVRNNNENNKNENNKNENKQKIDEMLNRETWMDAHEYLAQGFVDKIIE